MSDPKLSPFTYHEIGFQESTLHRLVAGFIASLTNDEINALLEHQIQQDLEVNELERLYALPDERDTITEQSE